MALYDKPVWKLLCEFADIHLTSPGDQSSVKAAEAWFSDNYPLVKKGTINAHVRMMSVNLQSRLNWTPRPHHNVFFSLGQGIFRRYDPEHDPAPIMSEEDRGSASPAAAVDNNQSSESSGTEFAYERDLQNFLAKNLNMVEEGLKLYHDEGINGLEFPVGGRRIDILAVSKDGDLVVLELKVSKGHDRVIGQILYYMNWIKENLADEGQEVRGIIIAKEISKELKAVCKRFDDVALREYSISFELSDIE